MLRITVDSTTDFDFYAAILQQLPKDIPQEVVLGWIQNKKALGKVLREALMPPAKTSDLTEKPKTSPFELLGTPDVSAQQAFKAADFFREEGQPDGIKFRLGTVFKNHFLKGSGEIDLDVPAATFNANKLREASTNAQILTALGGGNLAKTCLVYMAQLIKAQPQGEESVLLTKGWANIFYVEDDHGMLWAVNCFWDSDDSAWNVYINPITDSSKWDAGDQIVSPTALVP